MLGWRATKLGMSQTAQPNSIDVLLMLPALKGYFMYTYDASFDPLNWNMGKRPRACSQPARSSPTSRGRSVRNPKHAEYMARGRATMRQASRARSSSITVRYTGRNPLRSSVLCRTADIRDTSTSAGCGRPRSP